MPQNLRARLARIRKTQGEAGTAQGEDDGKKSPTPAPGSINQTEYGKWQEAGYKVMRRTLTLPFTLPTILPETLPWLVPDLERDRLGAISDLPDVPHIPPEDAAPERFLFFDLETTGLSGGAGTVAFLAAFGRFVHDPKTPDNLSKRNNVPGRAASGYTGLEVTQFLLLDYPGEDDFLEQVVSFIAPPDKPNRGSLKTSVSGGLPYFLTTYNGKAFDTQILKTRCLLNGFALPPFLQVDLLHPARRLWKRMLPNCSQATIETMVLGLDRTGDTPGSQAPDIWFNFLRAGGEFTGMGAGEESGRLPEHCRALLGICDHNVKDIFGLASLFRAFTEIAASPLDAAAHFNCDEENLAMRWRHSVRHDVLPNDNADENSQEKTAALLLKAAAAQYPRSCLRLGFDHFRRGRYEKGRAALQRLADKQSVWEIPCTAAIQALALRSLSIDAEHRLDRQDTALAYIERALSAEQPGGGEKASLPGGLREDLEKRKKRLCR
ncbi:MAG: ribonuclease H-like domain-containing protein [Spirochaetaceae bacterium]|jgi:hypothetical protein|nr:ribonuclease H-like domain-containing protein [Spirochaetaceae bacterium]